MSAFVFGTATREITPSYPVWMYGYADRDHRSNGVNEPLVLGCLALGDGSQTVASVLDDPSADRESEMHADRLLEEWPGER